MINADDFVLAGFVVPRPWIPPYDDALLPESVMTVSECLTDLLPVEQDEGAAPWHSDLQSARATAREHDVRVIAVHLQSADRLRVLESWKDWAPGLVDPMSTSLGMSARHVGQQLGLEVVGLEDDWLHSWLCYGLHTQAKAELDIAPGPFGLLDDLEHARAVAAMANDARGTSDGTPLDVTWFPALLAEC